MAIYRKINTTFWSDPFICDLSSDKKLFYLYLLTNERTKQCGIYDISKRQISFDLGISVKEVTDNLNFFSTKGKIMFSEDTNEIALRNWARFNGSTSPLVVKCVESELKLVKNRVCIEYIYSIDTLSQETQAPTQEEAPTETEEQAQEEIQLNGLVDLKNQLPTEKINFDELQRFFNGNRGNFSELKLFSDARKTRIKNLEKKYGKALIKIVIEKARDSDFLQGQNDKGWVASFDWITKPENFLKIAEDNYLNGKNGKPKQRHELTDAEIFTHALSNPAFKNFKFSK